MSVIPSESGESSSGGFVVVLFVFFAMAFVLTMGGQAIFERLTEQPVPDAQRFDATPAVDLIQPDPGYSPAEVVSIQIEGLQKPDISTGIQQCFAFASLENRKFTGPLERFAAMVRTQPYDVLMRHQLVLIGQPNIEDKKASVIVTLLDNQDLIRVFQFVLSKQGGEAFKDCWMTDAVYPLQQMPTATPADSSEDDERKSVLFENTFTPMWGLHG